jgi:valyl-tRNA synthetase
LHRYNVTLDLLAMYFADYDFDNVARTIHEFTWDCFCDWYLEIAKIQLAKEANGGDGQTKAVLHTVFEGLLRACTRSCLSSPKTSGLEYLNQASSLKTSSR